VDDPDANLRKLLPILVSDTDLPRLLKPLKYMDCRSQEKFEREYPQMLRSIRSTPGGEHTLSIDRSAGPGMLAPLKHLFIVGRPASGKSTFAQMLRTRLVARGRSVELTSDYRFLQALFRLDTARGRLDRFEMHPTSEFKVVDHTVYDEVLQMIHEDRFVRGSGNADVTVIEFSRPVYDTSFLNYTLKSLMSSAIVHLDAPLDLCIARNEHRRALLQARIDGADLGADVFAEIPDLHYVPASVFDRYRATASQFSDQVLLLALMPTRGCFNVVNDSWDLPRFKMPSEAFIDNDLVPLIERDECLHDYLARRRSLLAGVV
jgi:adenylate kinase family enzyme